MNKPQLPNGLPSILSRRFRYVPAADTDIAKTFARIRQDLGRDTRAPAANASLPKARKAGLGP